MGFDGNGNFLRIHNWQSDAEAGIKIRADRHDAEDDNIAEGLSNTLTRDGQSPPTANIPMNGFRIVTLGPPASGTDAATKAYVDGIKKFTNDIEVTDEVIFKDGTTTRGYIKGTIGSGVAASMVFETDNDAGTLVNRMTLDNNGLNLRTNGFRIAPGDVLRASFYGETSATPGAYLRAYDASAVEKALLALSGTFFYVKASDVAQTSYSIQMRQSDSVTRTGLVSDFSQADGKATLDIRNAAGSVRNKIDLELGGLTLQSGVFKAPTWVFPSSTVTMSGVVTVPSLIRFENTSTGAGTVVIQVQNKRTTVGAEGQAVFSIARQNSTTDALIFGADANNAALIGAHNTPLRIGKWVSGVFTEYLNLTTGGTLTAYGNVNVDTPTGAGGINILPTDGSSGRLFWNATTHTWATVVDESDGTFRFCSGGVFGTSTGTARFRLYENGDFLAGGKGSMTELQVDPTSAVTGIRLLASDTNSGRLFLEATTKKWCLSAWEGSGALTFTSGGVYGSSTGTTRMALFEDGQVETSGEMNAAFGVRVTRGYGTAIRGMFYVSSSGQMELNKIDVDGTTYTNRLLMGTNVSSFVAAAAATSYTLRLANGSAQRRIDLFYSATNPLALVARDATDDSLFCSLTANTSGVPFWTYRTGTAAEIVTTASLNLTTYTGSSSSNTDFPIGEEIMMYTNGVAVSRGASATPTLSNNDTIYYRLSGQPNAGTALAGTWRARGHIDSNWVAMRRTA